MLKVCLKFPEESCPMISETVSMVDGMPECTRSVESRIINKEYHVSIDRITNEKVHQTKEGEYWSYWCIDCQKYL
jgi:hypothetical protein